MLLERSQASFAVGESSGAQLGDGRLEPDGREHVLKIAAPGMVIMHVTRRQSSALGESWAARCQRFESPAIVVAAMQLGHGVRSIEKHARATVTVRRAIRRPAAITPRSAGPARVRRHPRRPGGTHPSAPAGGRVSGVDRDVHNHRDPSPITRSGPHQSSVISAPMTSFRPASLAATWARTAPANEFRSVTAMPA